MYHVYDELEFLHVVCLGELKNLMSVFRTSFFYNYMKRISLCLCFALLFYICIPVFIYFYSFILCSVKSLNTFLPNI